MPSYIEDLVVPRGKLQGGAMKNNDVPALVRELRRRLDLTQEQFAQEVGVTYSTVNRWENGKRVPQPFLFRRLLEMKDELDGRDKKSRKRKSSR